MNFGATWSRLSLLVQNDWDSDSTEASDKGNSSSSDMWGNTHQKLLTGEPTHTNSQTLPFQVWMQQMKQGQKEQQHLQYHRNLIEQLVSNMRACAKKQGPLACLDCEETLDKKPHCSDKLPCQSSKDSAVCNDHKTKRGRKKTVFFCKTCSNNPKLHPAECYVCLHTLPKYKWQTLA